MLASAEETHAAEKPLAQTKMPVCRGAGLRLDASLEAPPVLSLERVASALVKRPALSCEGVLCLQAAPKKTTAAEAAGNVDAA